ncbi:hypothetical protein AGMMS50212_12850 [Spirochaetia bacterium]|nr:hypothetical protein AGMMS50212_12850 [Spirochaetia bacterium]
MTVELYPFELVFKDDFAAFNFVFDGKPVDGAECIISAVKAGDMGFNSEIENPNRTQFFKHKNITDKKIFACKQIHSRSVVVVDKNCAYFAGEADGLITNDKSSALSVTVADCLPVFLFDTAQGVFSVLHSGWKGTGIAHNAISLMNEKFGTQAEDVAAILGPCIRACCYKVDSGRALVFENEFGNSDFSYPLGEVIKKTQREDGDFDWYIDMQAANAHILAKDGIRNIRYCKNCTFTDTRLGSFRREGAGSFTKMAALAYLGSDAL